VKKIGKALITDLSSFELVNTGYGYYFVVGAWISNFCHGFRTKKGKSFENRGRKVRENMAAGSAVTF